MSVQIVCPNPECESTYSVEEENLGKLGRCDRCGKEFPLIPGTRFEAEPLSSQIELDPIPNLAEDGLPESFGRYKVIRSLGRGGMGSVYLALDTQLNRQVALKVPHLHAFADRPDVRKRFIIEAQAAARFHHPNFCPIHDIGEVEGVPYLTMAFIEGKTLAASIEYNQGWPPRRAAEAVRELALALAKAHRGGIIHRDLKPANIMIDAEGRMVLMDFGLARWYDTVDSSLTASGAILGTPAYMPPEQAEGNLKAIGPRSDLYSLGVILYELLTGRRPFEGPITKVLGMIAFVEPEPPSTLCPDLDSRIEAICLKAMAKKLENRHASMDELAGALTGFLNETTVPAPVVSRTPVESPIPPIPTPEPKNVYPQPADIPKIPAPPNVDETLITNTIGMKLKLIPAGEFFMGAAKGESRAQADEKPQHKVQITRPFYLGVYEVTQAEYRAVIGTNPSCFSSEGGGKGQVAGKNTDRFPVENVSWLDAVAFCNKLSEREGLKPCYSAYDEPIASGTGYRLPTEAEWEYACRGVAAATTPKTTEFAFGAALSPTDANFNGNSTYNGSAKGSYLERPAWVGSYRPNAFGLYDMHGNVWEWCHDWYDEGYYAKSPSADPQNLSQTTYRVYRGGSCYYNPQFCRSAYRNWRNPYDRNSDLGFRVARVRSDK